MITTNSRDSRLHIDLGFSINKNISGIGIKIPVAEQYNIVGLKIYVIKIDETDPFNNSLMKVTSEKLITNADVSNLKIINDDVNYYTFLFPLKLNKDDLINTFNDIIINKEVVYDSTNKYLTTYKNGQLYYQVPYIIYKMPNNRKIMATTRVDSSDTLDLINTSDAITLLNFSTNVNMKTSPDIINSHILNPVLVRYIQFIPYGSKTLLNIIQKVTLYNSNGIVINTFVNPPIIYNLPNANYTSYLSDSSTGALNNGIILLDIGSNTLVTFVKIEISSISNMTNAVMNMINTSGNAMYVYTFVNPLSTNYIITDINTTNISGPYFVNKYSYPACLSLNICNIIAPDTYYILSDRCFRSNVNVDPTTCVNCMTGLASYSANNRISAIDTNFITCVNGKDTRFVILPELIRWDASVPANILKTGGVSANVGDTITSWIPTNNDNTLSLQISSGSFTKSLINNKSCVTKAAGSIIKIPNGSVFLNTINCISMFMVYRYPTVITNIIVPLQVCFKRNNVIDIIYFIFQDNVLKLNGTGVNTATVDSNYNIIATNTNIDVMGIQVSFYSNLCICKIRNNNIATIQTITTSISATLLDFTTPLQNIYIGGLGNSITNAYFGFGTTMNVYEFNLSDTFLSDDDFNTKYNGLVTKWIT